MADEAPEIPRILPTFASLPAEIRLGIIAAATEHSPLHPLAVVSREWQHEVEKKTFESLFIDIGGLYFLFKYVTEIREHLVKRISLSIELPDYGCRFCPGPGDFHTESNKNFYNCMDAYSPSDSEHFFKGYYVGDPREDEAFGDPRTVDDERHEFSHNGRSRPEDRDAEEVYDMFDRFIMPFSRATVVKRLIIRRQCRRQYNPPLFYSLLAALPALEHIHYEPWRMHNEEYQDREWYPGNGIISWHLPRNLKTLTLFEDFNEDFWPGSDAPERIPNAQTSEALVGASLNLERLSASFMVDAWDFFIASERRWYSERKWENLEFLALTSRFVGPKDDERLTDLLVAAGTFALRAPRLRTMILWYGRRNRAYAFIYNRDDTSITWHGIWPVHLNQQRITDIWQRVVDSHDTRVPLLTGTRMVTDEIKSHGDAIHYLGLPTGAVVDALSLRQIRVEGRIVYTD
ncbi:hypothetical protein CEP54_009760 [Fusarium duplospermum]|uniref:DUF6546 domain-containing protein n=1 Tax=Fusarium duplospermum TaxID=1325734 RepID=A0A428PNQ2_9HYPO|nr:hypothetical protein CEP54_009760 [Fusarium duplospermum]